MKLKQVEDIRKFKPEQLMTRDGNQVVGIFSKPDAEGKLAVLVVFSCPESECGHDFEHFCIDGRFDEDATSDMDILLKVAPVADWLLEDTNGTWRPLNEVTEDEMLTRINAASNVFTGRYAMISGTERDDVVEQSR